MRCSTCRCCWLWKAPYGHAFRQGRPAARAALRLRRHRDDRSQRSPATADCVDDPAGGRRSFFVGNAYQAQMPEFAHDLGHGDPGPVLQRAARRRCGRRVDAGFVLESRGCCRPLRAPHSCSRCSGAARSRGFALVRVLSARAGAAVRRRLPRAVVQLDGADAGAAATRRPTIRGRVIGLFSMSSARLATFSGVTVGLVGSAIGIHCLLPSARSRCWRSARCFWRVSSRAAHS